MPTLPGRSRTHEAARPATITTTVTAVKCATAATAVRLIRRGTVAASADAAADQYWGVLPPGWLVATNSHKSHAETIAAVVAVALSAVTAAAHGHLQQCNAIGRTVANNGICSRPTDANNAHGPYFSIFNLRGYESTDHTAAATLRWVDKLTRATTVISTHHVKLHRQHDQGRSN